MALDETRLAQLPPPIPREILFGNPEKASPLLSPDGAKLAYLAPKDGVLNVWVRTLGQTDDRAVTDDKKRGIRQFFWQEDSAHVLYLQDADGDENFHLYQTDVATGQTGDLTPFPGARALPLASDPNFPDTLLVSVNTRDPRLFDVYRLDLTTRVLALDTENPGDVAGFSADNGLQVRAAQVRLPDGGTEIRVRDAAGAPWRVFQTWGPEETGGGIAGFTPDNRSALVISSVEANAARLLRVDLNTGAQTVAAEDPSYDVGGVLRHPKTHALEPSSSSALGVSGRRWTPPWKTISRRWGPCGTATGRSPAATWPTPPGSSPTSWTTAPSPTTSTTARRRRPHPCFPASPH